MTDLEKYERVNKCDSLEDLAECILDFTDSSGYIEGRTKFFRAKEMAHACRNYSLDRHNSLTREFGIRQQAMYILFYQHTPKSLENNEKF